MLIGREDEQKAIKYLLNSNDFKSAIIYGRRRLGKTELIKQVVKNVDFPSIIYQCKESTEIDNTKLLTILIEDTFSLSHLSFDSFFDALHFLFELSIEKKFCLVIDEYPYIRELIDGCDSKLQWLIDSYTNTSKMKLFLIGSSINIMEEVFAHYSPLYGRFNQSILLSQMDYYDSAKFYPSFSNEDKVKLYSVFGGVPYYNVQIDEKQTVKENIIRLISGNFSGLRDYLETYLKLELRKVNNANVVFETIAFGAFHFSDILSKSHIDSSPALNTILQKLIKMDLIEYVSPINDKKNKQKAGYRIKDLTLRFYYNFIYKNESIHRILDDDVFFDKYIKRDFETIYVPQIFEIICKEYLIRKNRILELEPMLTDIGTYWYDDKINKKNGQFDVVGKSNDGYVFFECKYTNALVDDKVVKEETTQVLETNLKPIQFGFFSKNGFKFDNKENYLLFTLEDIYK